MSHHPASGSPLFEELRSEALHERDHAALLGLRHPLTNHDTDYTHMDEGHATRGFVQGRRKASRQSQLRSKRQLLPSATQVKPPLLPSLQMMPMLGTGTPSQPCASGHGVVIRGGTQKVVQAQAASFSLPHCCEVCTVLEGQSTAGRVGHSLAAQGR